MKVYSKPKRSKQLQGLFFGGVPKTITASEIKAYFEQFGTVKRFKLKKQRNRSKKNNSPRNGTQSNQSNRADNYIQPLHRGCGLVVFKDLKLHSSVLEMRHEIDGCFFDCKRAMNTTERKAYEAKAKQEKRKIFVGNLDSSFTKDDLYTYFSSFGTILELDLIQRSNGSKYCFIIFKEKLVGEKICQTVHELKPGVTAICEIANVRDICDSQGNQNITNKTTLMLFDSSKKSKFYENEENLRLNYQNRQLTKSLTQFESWPRKFDHRFLKGQFKKLGNIQNNLLWRG